ncbi:MAG: DUF642 domain-containing protein, partial [Planctomycetaceae bacterium]|nr:DUF642 domain-containing protein [Planctomycetaceae bacterium]
RPGSNWQATVGRFVSFQLNAPKTKRDREFIQLFLAEHRAKEEEQDKAIESSQPASEYLGKIADWHVYYLATQKAEAAWPTAKTDIEKALRSADDPKPRNNQLQSRANVDPIGTLVQKLNANNDLWVEGPAPSVVLPEYVRPKDVLEQAISKIRFGDHRISSYRVLEVRDIELTRWIADGYRAVYFDSNLGTKILVIRYGDHNQWFVRFFDVPSGKEQRTQEQEQATVDEDDYRRLHDRYKNLIRTAALKHDEVKVAQLTQEFIKSIERELVYVQVTPRVGPLLQHHPVITKSFGEMNPFGKLRFPLATKPHVIKQTNQADGVAYVLVETHEVERWKWSDDLQIRLVMTARPNSKSPPWGESQSGIQTRIHAAKLTWRQGEPLDLELDIRNQSEMAFHFNPDVRSCSILYKGEWYWHRRTTDRAKALAPGGQDQLPLKIALTEDGKPVWFSKKDHHPLDFPLGGHEIQVSLHPDRGFPAKDPVSNLFKFTIVPSTASRVPMNQTDWGKAVNGGQIRLRPAPLKGQAQSSEGLIWTMEQTPQFHLDIRNQGEANINYIPRPMFCEVEYDGNWYSLGGPHAYNGPATALPPGKEVKNILLLQLTHGEKTGWVSQKDQTPLSLSPGKHTIRVALALEKRFISNPVTIEVKPEIKIHVGPEPQASRDEGDGKPKGGEDDPTKPTTFREGNISWKIQGGEKHVSITDATDEDLAKLANQLDITELNLMDGKPLGIGIGQERPLGITNAGLRHLAGLKNLRVLRLPDRGITDEGLVHLKDLTNLTELWLDFLPVTDAGLPHLKDLKKLKVLRFHNAKLTDEGFAHLRDLRELEDLQLGGALLTDKSMPILATMTQLKTLDLRVPITDAGLVHLKELKELNWLCLNGTKISDKGLVNLAGLRKLNWLMLEDTAITDAGMGTISNLTTLTSLYLSGCQITDQGVAVISQLPDLKSLELSRTAITDQAVTSLVKIPQLDHLRLCETKLTDNGLEKLSEIKPLTFLEIRGTGVTQEGAKKMRTAKPKLMLQTDQNLPRKNLLNDGDFEKPTTNGAPWSVHGKGQLAGWTVEQGTVDVVAHYWKAAGGKQSLDLSGMENSPGTIYQDIATVPGQSYLIRFEAAANPEPADAKNSKRLNVYWGNQEVATLELFPEEQTFQDVGWQIFEYKVRGYGKTARLKFQSLTNTPCGPILDNISVSLIPAPN